jgi:protein gp37
MNRTIIAWTDYTLNVVSGCSKPPAVPASALPLAGGVDERWLKDGSSPECAKCYAETLSLKRGWSKQPWKTEHAAANIRLRPERFREIRRLPLQPITLPPSERTKCFIASMGDWAHELIPDSFIAEMWTWLLQYPNIYQMLTKRIERASRLPGPWPEHIWLGATCGHPATKWRIEVLRRSNAKVRFLSMEPLLGSMLPLDLTGIDWVIVGGESGANFRPMKMEWVREIRDECARQGVAFFMKQSASFFTERGCYLVEQDGRCMAYKQFPGELSAPIQVPPDNEKTHFKMYGETPTMQRSL